jgi:hypothetical protein
MCSTLYSVAPVKCARVQESAHKRVAGASSVDVLVGAHCHTTRQHNAAGSHTHNDAPGVTAISWVRPLCAITVARALSTSNDSHSYTTGPSCLPASYHNDST